MSKSSRPSVVPVMIATKFISSRHTGRSYVHTITPTESLKVETLAGMPSRRRYFYAF
jgi:hypothetical protein